jgi:hypothetical protein
MAPQAEPAMAPRDGPIGLAETVEYERQELRRDALAGVVHRDLDLVPVACHGDAHAAALGRELHCIGQQVPDDLLQAGEVGSDDGQVGVAP